MQWPGGIKKSRGPNLSNENPNQSMKVVSNFGPNQSMKV